MASIIPSVIKTTNSDSLQVIIDSIPIATLIIGPTGVFIDCNRTTLRIFEASSRDDIIGKPPDLLSPDKQKSGHDSGSEAETLIKKAYETGLITFNWDYVTLKGKIFEARVTLNVIQYEGKRCLMATITDMTNQVRIEEHKALIRYNPYGIYKLNPDLTIADMNVAFQKLSGYTREEWIGRKFSDFKVIRRNGPSVEEAILTKSTVTGNVVVEFPTGIKYLEYSYIPVYDAEGTLIQVYDIFSDLTGLNEKLSEADELIAKNPASILTIDPTGKILSVNPAFLETSHISEETLLSMKIQEFKILEREGESFSDVLSTKKTTKGRLVVDFDWVVKVLDFTYIPVLDVNGDLVKCVAMYIDVTDQVAYIDKNQTFIHENPSAILMVKPDMSITDVNPALLKITGYTIEEALRMKLTDFKVINRSGETLKTALQTKKVVRGSLTLDAPAGIRNLDYVYIPIMDKKGTVIQITELFSDMTAISSMVQYLNKSVELIQDNINSLSRGDTTFTTTILEADEHSASAKEHFITIGNAVDIARNAIYQLVHDSNALTQAAIAGNLHFRSDPSVHQGDFRTIIEGMNQTLDLIGVPINEAVKVAKDYANCDFTSRIDPNIEIKGDWIEFKESLNNIGLQVSQIISLINKNVAELAASAEEANASVEEVVAGAQQIAVNTGRVSQNADQGGDGIFQVLRAMEDLNETVGSVSQKADSVASASNEANILAKGGIDLARQSEKAMGDITISTEEVDSIVSGINSQMVEIGKIVRLISDIANQTNLLALNAAIEAARAGEAGRGFAVVAAEVKSLAQDSRKSAEDIADMISTLQSKAKQASDAMGRSTHAVMDGSSALEETLKAFNRIAETIDNINKNTVEVASASEEQAASVEEVSASIQEVSNLIQNTSQEAGDAAAATEEASASIDEIGRIMTGVVDIVDRVTKEMGKFKVS